MMNTIESASNEIKYIFHIADIHIMEKNYLNIKHSWNQLMHIMKGEDTNRILLVIAGDIFENKTYMSSDDVHFFYGLMEQLEDAHIETVIIPGNHDYNINSKCALDNITILLQSKRNGCGTFKYIKCYSTTGIYTIKNIFFYVYSPIDKENPEKKQLSAQHIQTNTELTNTELTNKKLTNTELTNKWLYTRNIALLHEPINIMKNIESDKKEYIGTESIKGRYSVDDIKHYDMVMLGDIHKPHFLTDNIAYAGSFVQKNRGEGLNHGYIKWDMATCTGLHYWLELKQIALKIVAEKNQFVAELPDVNAEITYLGFIHIECSPEWVNNAAAVIREKYGCVISQITKLDRTTYMPTIDIGGSLSMNTDNFTHSTLIRNKLMGNKTNPEMIERVIDMHNKFIKNRRLYPTIRYYIKYLAWNNVLCYGENNYINFEELTGLVALIGRNKTGKSSVIDILIRILFNECARGYKEDIINKYAKSGYIKCCFRIMNDEYIIEQSWQKYTAAITHNLYKNGENITKDTINKTYKYMSDELGLGNYKDFVNLTTALQNRQFIIDLNKKDIYSLLCKLLDIDTLKDIEENVKKEKEFLRRERKGKMKELDTLCVMKEEEQKILNEIYMRDINLKETCENELSIIRDHICRLHRQIIPINLPDGWTPTKSKPPNSMPLTSAEYINKLEQKAKYQNKLLSIVEQIKIYKSEINNNYNKPTQETINEMYKYFEVDAATNIIKHLNKLNALSAKKLWNIEPYKTKYEYMELLKIKNDSVEKSIELNDDIDELYTKLKPTTQKQILLCSAPDTELNILMEQINKVNDAESNINIYKTQCTTIQEIKQTIIKSHFEEHSCTNFDKLNKGNSILSSINNCIDLIYAKYNDKYNEAVNVINLDKMAINNDIKQWHKYNEIQENNKIIEYNEEIYNQINEYKIYKNAIHDIEQYNKINENKEIETARNILASYKYVVNMTKINELEESKKITMNKMQKIIDSINEYENVEAQHKEYNKLYGESYEVRLRQYEQAKLNENIDKEINELKQKETEYINKLNLLNMAIGGHIKKIDRAKLAATTKADLMASINELDDITALYDSYYSCINHKTGIPSNILKQVCVALTTKCNDILNVITDFNVEFEYDEDIHIYTISRKGDKAIKLHASLGSGFQKFILDMILRIVLTKLSNISNPNILFIDEGFGCLDKDNFINVCGCLQKLKDNFDAMIIITHIPELQAYMNQIIEVKTDMIQSQLQFGQMSINQIDRFENSILRQIRDNIDNKETAPNIMIQNIQTPDVNAEIDGVWHQHMQELCRRLDTEPDNLFNAIIGKMIPLVDEKYTCIPCQKGFKKIEQARAHVGTKTYKSKHFKYLMNIGTPTRRQSPQINKSTTALVN